MALLKNLQNINKMIEASLVIDLTDQDFAAGWKEIEQTYFHEACHAAITHCVPWVQTLDEEEHTAVDEILARFLTLEFGPSFGIAAKSPEAVVHELRLYPVDVTQYDYEHLLGVWQTFFWPNKDLAGMATYLLTYLRHQRVIYHILPRRDWLAVEKVGVYEPPSLEVEGFIHCSKIDQVLASANNYFKDQDDLYLLCIASDKIRAEIRYEDLVDAGKLFPHIYGPLNLDAVVNVSPLEKSWRGKFVLPAGLSALSKD